MPVTESAVRTSEFATVQPAVDQRPPEPETPVGALRAATLSTLDGVVITHGIAELRGTAQQWSATLRQLDRPGVMATAYFGAGIREGVLALNDGRRARAHIAATSFVAGSERVCELAGREPLSRGSAV
jgi:hypothetical protein